MRHPSPEEWMDFLYQETSPSANAELARHLENCEECRGAVDRWRGAREQLDKWPMGAGGSQRGVFRARFAWGLAAAITLFVGVGLGQVTARSSEADRVAQILEPRLRLQIKTTAVEESRQALQAMQDQLETRVRQRIEAQFDRKLAEATASTSQEMGRLVVKVADSMNTLRETDKAELLGLLRQVETDELVRLTSMRKDLETVAIVGQTKIDDAQQQIGHIVSVSQALYHPNSQDH